MVNQSNALSLLFCYFKITALYHWADTSLHIPLAVSIVLLFQNHNSLPLGRYISCRAPHPIPFMSYLTRSPPPQDVSKNEGGQIQLHGIFFKSLKKRYFSLFFRHCGIAKLFGAFQAQKVTIYNIKRPSLCCLLPG